MRYLPYILILTLLSCSKLDLKFNVPKGVILLDFDGYYVDSTNWNVYDTPFTAPASALTPEQIKYCVDSVSYDFKPFNILVTTNEAVYNSFNPTKRVRIVVTSSNEFLPKGVGGTAFVGSFSWGDNTPAFVFSHLLGNKEKAVAEAISHEAGHTLGLYHQSLWVDGKKVNEYNPGSNGIAPIMGVSYNSVGIWWNGTNSRGVIQNDTATINYSINQKRAFQRLSNENPVVCIIKETLK